MLSNVSIMNVDLFGVRSAGFSNALLACVSAAAQVLVSPAIGAVADRLARPTPERAAGRPCAPSARADWHPRTPEYKESGRGRNSDNSAEIPGRQEASCPDP
jgi:hypothetical protein